MIRHSNARPCVLCSETVCGTYELGTDVRLFACEPCLISAAFRELTRQAARDANKRDLGGKTQTVPPKLIPLNQQAELVSWSAMTAAIVREGKS